MLRSTESGVSTSSPISTIYREGEVLVFIAQPKYLKSGLKKRKLSARRLIDRHEEMIALAITNTRRLTGRSRL